MNQNFDLFGFPEPAAITLCNPEKTELYSLGLAYNTKIIKRFNALSEFSFLFPESIDGNKTQLEAYYLLNNKRVVLVEGHGYFQITDVEEILDGSTNIKSITCMSLENELISKRVVAFGGTRPLYNIFSPEGTILKEMSDLCGGLWTVGTVDAALLSTFRTFDVKDSNIYEFLMGDVSKAFECVFTFDTVNRTISADPISDATSQTDIFLSFDNLIKSATFSEKSDEITTVLEVHGGADLTINGVNPLGTAKIYNFDYYANPNWMSSELVSAITAWKNVVNSQQPLYSQLLVLLQTFNAALLTLQSDLVDLEAEYTALETVMKARIELGVPFLDIKMQMSAKRETINIQRGLITTKESEITATTSSMAAVNSMVSFSNNFSEPELLELQNFMFENTYLNSNIIQTDSMNAVEIQQQRQQLYDQAQNVLAKVSQPRYEFTLDAINYIDLQEFEDTFTTDTEMGCVVTAELRDGTLIETVLLELAFSFDDPTDFTMTFSNRLRLDGAGYTYSDLLGQIAKTGSSVAFDDYAWANWSTEYKDDVSEFITSALDAARNTIINSSNQEIVINQNGLRGRRLDPETEEYDPTQVWLTSSILAFTDDAWDSAKLALGNITLPGGGSAFGLVADVLVGRVLAGNSLTITNENGSFIVTGDSVTITNLDLIIESNNGGSVSGPGTFSGARVEIDPTGDNPIFKLRKAEWIPAYSNYGWVDKFWIDLDGNVHLTGTLEAATGSFSGDVSATSGHIGSLVIDSQGLKTSDGVNYLRGDGDLHWGALTISGSTATFSGNVYANNIKDDVESPVFTAAGIMSGDRVYAGTITGPGIEIALGATGNPTITGTGIIELRGGSAGGFMNVGSTSYWYATTLGLETTGNLAILGNNISLSSPNAVVVNTHLNMASTKNITLSGGGTLHTGGGNVTITGSGNLSLFDGDVSLTNGDIILQTGSIFLAAGSLVVGASTGATGTIQYIDHSSVQKTAHFTGGLYTGTTIP